MKQLQHSDAASQVFVGGTLGINKKKLRDHFEAYGTVLSVRLAYDRAGRRRGFGFVQFKHASSAQQASLVGLQHKIAGRLVTVQPFHQSLKPQVSDSTSSKPQPDRHTTQDPVSSSAGQGTHARQTQAQHSGSISETACVGLLDVLQQVPMLPDILTPDAQKALSSTCKTCRRQFMAQVQVVTILHPEDYALVFEGRWPQLSMVILQHTDAICAIFQPLASTRIVDVHVSAGGVMSSQPLCLISMLRPLHNLATHLPCARLAAQQFAHQMHVRWPSMSTFAMSHVHDQDGLGLEIVSQLVKGTWTDLETLQLSHCDLKAEGFLILSQGDWPCLLLLDVSGNCLNAEGMALLAKGNWPLLANIALSFDPTMDAAAVGHLFAANWPLESLSISGTPFSADMAAELAGLQLPNLESLFLSDSGLTAAAVSSLQGQIGQASSTSI